MNRYTIYCTEEQTKRAFELGAFLKHVFYNVQSQETARLYHLIIINDKGYEIPTAEQMIGWLEEHEEMRVEISTGIVHKWFYYIHIGYPPEYKNLFNINFTSRKEATLAAIGAALEYLINNKK